jgi:HEAT repeat protein
MSFGFGTQDVQEMKEKRDVDGLIKALGCEKDSSVRMNAAEALGAIGDSKAVEPLTRMPSDANRYVRRNTVEALEKLGWIPG